MSIKKILVGVPIVVMLTACGGGGGGGSEETTNSTPDEPSCEELGTCIQPENYIVPAGTSWRTALAGEEVTLDAGLVLDARAANVSSTQITTGLTATGTSAVANNLGTIKVTNGRAIAVATGATGNNYNKIEVSGTGSGMYATSSSSITNAKTSGVIDVAGGGFGMWGDSTSTISNDGVINVTNGTGIRTANTGTNSGTINASNVGSVGILNEGTQSIGSGGTINVSAGAIGMKATAGGTVANGKTTSGAMAINVSGDGSIGLLAEGTNSFAENFDGRITLNGTTENIIGLKATNGARIGNRAELVVHTGTGMQGENGSEVVNFRSAIQLESDSWGARGIWVFGSRSFGENMGSVNVFGEAGIGMLAEEGARIENAENGLIHIKGEGGFGMKAVGAGSALNIEHINEFATQNITVEATNAKGMFSDGSSDVKNAGDIYVENYIGASGMYSLGGGTVTNETTGIIVIRGTQATAMIAAGQNSVAINKGRITTELTSGGKAMTGTGSVYNEVGGEIFLRNGSSVGIERNTANYATFENKGVIHVDANSAVGMRTLNNLITSTGEIYVGNKDFSISNGKGMTADAGSTAQNNGIIEVWSNATSLSNAGVGMLAKNGGTIENLSNGTIYVYGNYGIGMYGDATSTINNYGRIDLLGTNGVGIYTEGATINNIGTINVGGTGNRDYITGGSIILNSGTMMFTNKLVADGQLVMKKGGTLSANSVEGTIYVGGDIVPLYSKTGTSSSAIFQTGDKLATWFNAKIKSLSDLFVSSYVNKGTSIDLTLTRKDYRDVMTNKNLGAYLENISSSDSTTLYSEGQNVERDKALRLMTEARSVEAGERAVSTGLGLDFFGTLQELSYAAVNYSQNTINKTLDTFNFEKKEVVPVAGYETTYFDTESTEDTQGYFGQSNFAYLGMQKVLANGLGIGVVGSINQAKDIKFSGSGQADFDSYQANLLFGYQTSTKINLYASPYFGKLTGEYTRDLGEKPTDYTNNYYGTILKINTYYNAKNYFLIPEASLDIGHFTQEEIEEGTSSSSDVVAVKINESTFDKVTPAIGITVGKKFAFGNSYKFTPSFKLSDSYETGITKAEGSIKGVSGYTFETTDDYNGKNKLAGTLKLELAKQNFSIYTEGEYSTSKGNENSKASLGFIFKF